MKEMYENYNQGNIIQHFSNYITIKLAKTHDSDQIKSRLTNINNLLSLTNDGLCHGLSLSYTLSLYDINHAKTKRWNNTLCNLGTLEAPDKDMLKNINIRLYEQWLDERLRLEDIELILDYQKVGAETNEKQCRWLSSCKEVEFINTDQDQPGTIRTIAQDGINIVHREVASGNFDINDLYFLLKQEYLQNSICLLHSANHTCALSCDERGWIFYDSNISDQIQNVFSNTEELIEAINRSIGLCLSIEIAALSTFNNLNDFRNSYHNLLSQKYKILLQNSGLSMIMGYLPSFIVLSNAMGNNLELNSLVYSLLNTKNFICSQSESESAGESRGASEDKSEGSKKFNNPIMNFMIAMPEAFFLLLQHVNDNRSMKLLCDSLFCAGHENFAPINSMTSKGFSLLSDYVKNNKELRTMILEKLLQSDEGGWTVLHILMTDNPKLLPGLFALAKPDLTTKLFNALVVVDTEVKKNSLHALVENEGAEIYLLLLAKEINKQEDLQLFLEALITNDDEGSSPLKMLIDNESLLNSSPLTELINKLIHWTNANPIDLNKPIYEQLESAIRKQLGKQHEYSGASTMQPNNQQMYSGSTIVSLERIRGLLNATNLLHAQRNVSTNGQAFFNASNNLINQESSEEYVNFCNSKGVSVNEHSFSEDKKP